MDPTAFKGAYLSNQRELGDKVDCSGKLTHHSIFRNWTHHNDINGLRVMCFSILVNQDFRRTDISSLQRMFLPNQKEPICEANLSTILRQNRIFTNWFQVNSYSGLKVMNFLNRRFYRLSICEYRLLEVDFSLTKRRPEQNPIIEFKMDLLALQQAKNEENWSWECQVMINLLNRVKPVLQLPHLEFRRFDNLQTKCEFYQNSTKEIIYLVFNLGF